MRARWIVRSCSLVAVGVLLSAGLAYAEGSEPPFLAIAPGEWKFELETMLAAATEPQRTTRSQCIETDRLDPTRFVLGEGGTGCEITDVQVEGKSMTWSQACVQGRGLSNGKAEAKVEGDSASGKMEMTIMLGAHPIPMITTWTAKRIGECKQEAAK
jgi:hypothetical protein